VPGTLSTAILAACLFIVAGMIVAWDQITRDIYGAQDQCSAADSAGREARKDAERSPSRVNKRMLAFRVRRQPPPAAR